MGQFRFEVPDEAADWFVPELARDAYLCGIEGVPFQTLVQWDSGQLTLTRNLDSSAKLHVTCRVPEIGLRSLSTCSLPPCEPGRSYPLALELARGSCYQARLHGDVWKQSGLKAGDTYEELLNEGTQAFLQAASIHRDQPDEASGWSLRAISILQQCLDELSRRYALQSISTRKNRETQLATLLSASVIPPDPFATADMLADQPRWRSYCEAFNTIAIGMSWADVETDSGSLHFELIDRLVDRAIESGLRIIAGPLIDFRSKLLPHWIYLYENDYEALLAAAVGYVEKVVARYRGRVQVWNVASSLNTPGPLPLDDEKAMRFAVGVLQAVRRTDPNTAAILSFDQPCGEYLARHRNGISPMHFADAISRSGLGMAGLGLEFRMGYQSDSTPPRSPIDLSTTIDRWATLSMPLLITMASPAAVGPDHHSRSAVPVHETQRLREDGEAEQLRIAGPLLQMLLSKPIVHGVVWEGWDDRTPHVSSHSGLWTPDGQPRPLLDYMLRLRQDFLF